MNQTSPCNIKFKEKDQVIADTIITIENNYIVRYIRKPAAVNWARIPVYNNDGSVIKDMYTKQKVICAGTPYACMIAFQHEEKLLVGWSKRIETQKFIKTGELIDLFRTILDDKSPSYEVVYENFTSKLISFLKCQPPKTYEISFSKKAGKIAAVIRGLNDNISISKNFICSESSGPIPSSVSKNLPWFIKRAEKVFDVKVANVSYKDRVVSKYMCELPVKT